MEPYYTGKVHTVQDSPSSKVIEWKIKNIFEVGCSGRTSPEFSFLACKCIITVRVNELSGICFSLLCRSDRDLPNTRICFQLAVKKRGGTLHEIPVTNGKSCVSPNATLGYDIVWSEFIDEKEAFFPRGVMTLVCKMNIFAPEGASSAHDHTTTYHTTTYHTSAQLKHSIDSLRKRKEALQLSKEMPGEERPYGKLSIYVSLTRIDVTWKVPDFLDIECDPFTGVMSSIFWPRGGKAFLSLHPHYQKGLLQLTMHIICDMGTGVRNPEVSCEIYLKGTDGRLYKSLDDDGLDNLQNPKGCIFKRYFKMSVFYSELESLMPDGELTVYAKLSNEEKIVEVATDLEKRSLMKTGKESATSAHYDISSDDLLRALKKLSIGEEDKDVIIKVKGQEFTTFISILRARAPVFASEIIENVEYLENRSVDISGVCGLDTFRAFMDFVHTGMVEQPLSTDTAFELYVMADRYKLEELKELCIQRTKRKQPFILAA